MSFRPLLAAGAVSLALGAAGCKCGRDRPYVPYSIGDGATNAGADADGGGAGAGAGLAVEQADAGATFAEQPGLVAPPNVSQWTVDGVALVAPAERVFVAAAVKDVDGDGTKDALAVVRPAATAADQTPSDTAEIVFFKGGGAPLTIGAPIQLGAETSCPPTSKQPPKQRIGFIGKASAVVELSTACPPRWFGIVALGGRAPRVSWSTTIADPPASPALTIEADGADRDGDGIDDVTLRVSMEGGGPPFEPGPKVSALLRWFDRPAGMSRDPDEPDASLRALASQAATRAGRAKQAPTVPSLVRQIRQLYSATCAEGGATRLLAKISCGPSRALEEAGLAEVRAYATGGDVLRAATALERAQVAPATRNASRTKDAEAWITQAAPVDANATLRVVAAVPQLDRGKAPAWGALAFEASGKLLVRTAAGVVRVDPVLGDEGAATDVAPASWKTQVLAPDGGTQLVEAYSPCDGVALHATFAPRGQDGEPHDVALPIAPPLGTRCTSGKGELARVLPIAWGQGGLEAIVAGEPILVSSDLARASALENLLDQPPSLGSPRSPGGKTLAVPTSLGVLVRGPAAGKNRLLRAKELEGGYGELRDCTVSDDGLRVACARGGRAFAGVWTE